MNMNRNRVAAVFAAVSVSVAALTGCTGNVGVPDATSVKKAGQAATERAEKMITDNTGSAVKKMRNRNVSKKERWFLGCNAVNLAVAGNNAKTSGPVKVLQAGVRHAPNAQYREWARAALTVAEAGKRANKLPKSVRSQVAAPCKQHGVNMNALT